METNSKILGMFEKKINYFKLIVSSFASYYFISFAVDHNIEKWNLVDSIDLIFHEAGHTIFIFFGNFIQVLAGSGFEIFVPLFFVLYFFLYKNEFFSGSLLMFWLGQSILGVAVYMGDSVRLELPLLGGDGVIHDWNYILSTINLLKYTDILANITHAIGGVIIVLAAVLCFFLSCYNRKT